MKKAVLFVILAFTALFFVGCAKSTATDTFRFETREIEVLVGEEKTLGIILGDNDKTSTIVYHMEAVANELGEVEIPASRIISLNGVSSTYYYRDTTRGAKEQLTVIGKLPGTVKISAHIEGNENVTDTIIVYVKDTLLTAYKINTPKTSLNVGEKITLSTVSYPDNIKKDAFFYTENPDLLDVTKNGHVTALKGGEAIVCAKSLYDDQLVAKVKIIVIEPVLQKIEVTSPEQSVILGRTLDLGLKFVPSKPSNDLIIKNSNEEVISVDENGVVTALKPGTSKVTFSCAGKQVSVDVTVLGDFETGLTCDDSVEEEFAMEKGSTKEISYTVLPDTASQLGKVEVSDNSIIKYEVVENKVTLTAVGVGTATVYVKSPMSTFIKKYVVTVDYAPATSIKANPTTVSVKAGSSKEVKINVEPFGAKQEISVELTSTIFTFTLDDANDELVITITGTSVGEGVLTIKTIDGTITLELPVKVTE